MDTIKGLINLFDMLIGNINNNLQFSNSSIETILFVTHWATYIISLSCYLLYRSKRKEGVDIKCLNAGAKIFFLQGLYWTFTGVAVVIDNPFLISFGLIFSVPSSLMILSYISQESIVRLYKKPAIFSVLMIIASAIIYSLDLSILGDVLPNGNFSAYSFPVVLACSYPFFLIIKKSLKSRRLGVVKTSKVSAIALSFLNLVSFIHFCGFRLEASHLIFGYGMIFITYTMYFAYIITETFITIHENSAISNNLSILLHDYGKNNLFYIQNATKILASRYNSKLSEEDRESVQKHLSNIEKKAKETHDAIASLRESEKEFMKNSIDIKNTRLSFEDLRDLLSLALKDRFQSVDINISEESKMCSFIISPLFINRVLLGNILPKNDDATISYYIGQEGNNPIIRLNIGRRENSQLEEISNIQSISSKLGAEANYLKTNDNTSEHWTFTLKGSVIQKYSEDNSTSNVIDIKELLL